MITYYYFHIIVYEVNRMTETFWATGEICYEFIEPTYCLEIFVKYCMGNLDVSVSSSTFFYSSFSKNVCSALNASLQFVGNSRNRVLLDQKWEHVTSSWLPTSLKRKPGAFITFSMFYVISPASASFTSFPTVAYSALVSRLPSCTLDMSRTHVKNLRNFALAGPFSKVLLPVTCLALFLTSFGPSLKCFLLTPAETCMHPYIPQHPLLLFALHFFTMHLIFAC